MTGGYPLATCLAEVNPPGNDQRPGGTLPYVNRQTPAEHYLPHPSDVGGNRTGCFCDQGNPSCVAKFYHVVCNVAFQLSDCTLQVVHSSLFHGPSRGGGGKWSLCMGGGKEGRGGHPIWKGKGYGHSAYRRKGREKGGESSVPMWTHPPLIAEYTSENERNTCAYWAPSSTSVWTNVQLFIANWPLF